MAVYRWMLLDSDEPSREYQSTRFMFHSLKSCRLWDDVEKYGTTKQTTDDNTE
jgi:hypothetical protein